MRRKRWYIPGLVLGSCLSLMLVGVSAASAAAPKCFGKPATIQGTSHADRLKGTGRVDVIVGLGGNDSISGLGANDLICGGPGSDELDGDVGKDKLDGGPGDDVVDGDVGNDLVMGGPGDDYLWGHAGNDQLDGGDGWDFAVFADSPSGVTASLATGEAAGEGTDVVMGIEGLVGSRLADDFVGSDDYDVFIPLGGDDVLDGGLGFDWVGFYPAPGPVTVDLSLGTATGDGSDTLAGIERIDGSRFDDTLTGDVGPNVIWGNEGNDSISGGDGDDVLEAGAGTDSVDGGIGTDACNDAETVVNCES